MKKSLSCLCCIATTLFIFVQCNNLSGQLPENTPAHISSFHSEPPYEIGYIYDPVNKMVGFNEMVGGIDEDGSHWDGYQYVRDTSAIYDDLEIIILEDNIYRSDKLPFDCDWDNLQPINNKIFKDKEYIYYKSGAKVDIRNYECLHPYIYKQKDGTLYFLSDDGYKNKFQRISGIPPLDIPTLKQIDDHYFTDKNGLYYLGFHLGYKTPDSRFKELLYHSVKIEDSNGKDIQPIISSHYFIYNNHVYALKNNKEIERLDLDGAKTKEILLSEYEKNYLLSDGDSVYYRSNGWYDSSEFSNNWLHYCFDADLLRSGVNEWKTLLRSYSGFYTDNEEKNLYITSQKEEHEGFLNNLMVAYTPAGIYSFKRHKRETTRKHDNIYIYNYDSKEYEILDINEYHCINGDLYIYKNRLYTSENVPLIHKLNLESVQLIAKNGKKSHYLTDGKKLYYYYVTGYMVREDKQGNRLYESYLPINQVEEGIDFKSLQIIDKYTLIDNNYIYRNGEIIPRDSLGINIKLYIKDKPRYIPL